VTFGLNGVYRLLLGGQGDLDENQMMQMQVRACLPACHLVACLCALADEGRWE